MNKIIVLDWSIFLNMAVYACRKLPMQSTYLAMTMILGSLKKIGVEPDDEIIIACDSLDNWRKQYIPQTKADRQAIRDKSGINWEQKYQEFDNLLTRLDESTGWHIIKIDSLECDDIMAIISKFYKDKEVILVTTDSDLEQMFHFENVKIFSPHRLMKRYKIKPKNFNTYKLIAKTVTTKGHNNLGIELKDESDYAIKELCVNLIDLPEWIEEKVINILKNLKPKIENINRFPFFKLRERYNGLYNDKENIITYEDCLKKEERKKLKIKTKKGIKNATE